MHHLPRFFSGSKGTSSKANKAMDRNKSRRRPKLERRNALKHIYYDATTNSSDYSSHAPLHTRSLDLSDRTSFRVEGNAGDMERIWADLSFSGPDDFSIPEAVWEARKIRSTISDVLPMAKLYRLDSPDSPRPDPTRTTKPVMMSCVIELGIVRYPTRVTKPVMMRCRSCAIELGIVRYPTRVTKRVMMRWRSCVIELGIALLLRRLLLWQPSRVVVLVVVVVMLGSELRECGRRG